MTPDIVLGVWEGDIEAAEAPFPHFDNWATSNTLS